MNQQSVHTSKHLLWVCIPFLLLSFSIPATAATSPKPGSYCPGKDILLVVAEDLSASLDLAMHSRAAQRHNDKATAISKLTSLGTTLSLAASRGAAARTRMLIDVIIEIVTNKDNVQTLVWFPLLQTSMLTLPDDPTMSAVSDWIGRTDDIMQGDRDGDPMKSLMEARHMLACDDLDIPLQAAIQAQSKLMKQLGPKKSAKNISTYDTLLDSLRRALLYTLQNNEK